MIKIFTLVVLCFGLCAWACKTPTAVGPEVPADYEAQLAAWRQDRLASLTEPAGWLSMVGLFWLQEGENPCGSGAYQGVTLPPTAPAYAGKYTLQNGVVTCETSTGNAVRADSDDACAMSWGSLRWYLLERGGRYGVRVQDTLLPSRIRLRAIENFPTDVSYRVAARWEKSNTTDSVLMRNVLDMEYPVPVAGKLRFTLANRQHELIALDGGPEELFLIFSDQTTGDSTYGGGRYLYCPRPDANGQTIIDFNRAYNPPCAFTQFATCLLPRSENGLPVPVLAGEKTYGEH
jgi:uncharacterized protein